MSHPIPDVAERSESHLRDQATALERIADALETIAKPRDQANLGMAMQLKAAEQLAADRLLQLRAVKVIVDDGSISGLEMETRILAFLGSVLP